MAFGMYLVVKRVEGDQVTFDSNFEGDLGIHAQFPSKRYLGRTMRVLSKGSASMPTVGTVADPSHPLDVFGRGSEVQVEWL